MIRLIIGAIIGFGAFYLYENPGDIEGLLDMFMATTNEAAVKLAELTEN